MKLGFVTMQTPVSETGVTFKWKWKIYSKWSFNNPRFIRFWSLQTPVAVTPFWLSNKAHFQWPYFEPGSLSNHSLENLTLLPNEANFQTILKFCFNIPRSIVNITNYYGSTTSFHFISPSLITPARSDKYAALSWTIN